VGLLLGVAGLALALEAALSPSGPLDSRPPRSAEQLLREAEEIDGVLSLLAVRDGELLAEGYFEGAQPGQLLHLRSGTKSVTSLLIGIALDRGDLESPVQTLGALLGPEVERFGPEKAGLTLHQLLSMTAGLEWDESDVSEFNRLVSSRDPARHYLGRPFVQPPGAKWEYSSGASHLLSVVLHAATGERAEDYARRHLFEPLGITDFRWDKLRDGNSNGSAGLQLRSRDFLRLGVLAGGSWEGRQVVSREWIARSTSEQVPIDHESGYGYQWWINGRPRFAFSALGHGGQILIVMPEFDAIAVMNCRWRSRGRTVAAQMEAVMGFLENRLAPFVVPEFEEIRRRYASTR
jgi:CubicO group peptidase (beta-lactamase class C family)